MQNYIIDKFEELIETKEEPNYESISIKDFLIEFDYATKYLSRLLKGPSLIIYLLLFKMAYFVEGKRRVKVKKSDLGKELYSNRGKSNSIEESAINLTINNLLKLNIIEKAKDIKHGQISEYIIKLPSEIREVKLMIEEDNKIPEIYDDSRDDFYYDKSKKLEILKRDEYQCFYCKCSLLQDNFYLDHLHPQSDGGYNWKSNLVSSCRTCNTRKNASDAFDFLLDNYRKSLLNQKEYLEQKSKLDALSMEYNRLKEMDINS